MAELRRVVRERGGAVLSREYVDTRTKLRFRCHEGHEWEATPEPIVLRGTWCPVCGRERTAASRRALGKAEIEQAVRKRRGEILSAYVRSAAPMRFRCRSGHEWTSTPNKVQQGRWCPTCTRAALQEERTTPTRRALERIARARGGRVLAFFVDGRSRARLRCAEGHEWETQAAVVTCMDGWCPTCASGKLDIETMHELAAQWGGRCSSTEYNGTEQPLLWRCAEGHRWRASPASIRAGRWCRRCRGTPRDDLARMRRIARQRGGECLSEEYRGSTEKLRWRCREGHVWDTTPATVIQGSWCPRCRLGPGRSTQRLSIDDMHETAGERGGRCVSEHYVNANTKLRWQCAQGHEWLARPAQVRQGSWCRICSSSVPGTLDVMRRLAKALGGRCVSTTWNDHRQRLEFVCAKGHAFFALGGVVKSGVWCPQCPKRRRPSVRELLSGPPRQR
jgi:hypothetical protein